MPQYENTKLIQSSLEHDQLSDPLCDSVNRGLTLIRLFSELILFYASPYKGITTSHDQVSLVHFHVQRRDPGLLSADLNSHQHSLCQGDEYSE